MALLQGLESISASTVVFVLSWSLFTLIVHRIWLHPLRSVPGPYIARCTSLWLYYHAWKGDEASQIASMHKRYGSVVRIAPNEVDIDDGEALAQIYSAKGGFLKAECYLNFDIEGHHTIFSAIDMEHRRSRAKAVVGMFANSSIYGRSEVLSRTADALVRRLGEEAGTGRPVDVLNLTRSLAVDGVTSYLFGSSYGGVDEKTSQLSASHFVNELVAVGRFFYLPHGLFLRLEQLIAKTSRKSDVSESMAHVAAYVDGLVDAARPNDATYQARLLDAGFSKHEAKIQCEDLMFAGTDSTGMNLAMICWHLVGNPDVYARLRRELLGGDDDDEEDGSGNGDGNGGTTVGFPAERLQTLPYLRAVVAEGLRISFANPNRLPRVVPAGGWRFAGLDLPAGTVVGVGSWQTHLNEAVFTDAAAFRPERWLRPTPEMQRDFFPFGLGPRQCIARNLAMAELLIAVDALVRSDVLRGAERVAEKVDILQWFNSKVVSEKIELMWPQKS